MSRQELQSYNQIREAIPSAKDNFVRDYSAMKDDITQAEKSIISLSPQFGVGSPEGVAIANLSQIYFDTTNSPASVTMYTNSTVGSDTGWVVVA